jgi:hypothetical protein
MNQDKFISLVKSITKGLYLDEISGVLRKNGFKFFFAGAYKNVYRHPEHKDFVVKVYKHASDYQEDSYYCPKRISRHVLHPLFKSKKYLIQEFANGRGGDSRSACNKILKELKTARYFDIEPRNCRFHNNRPVIIDYCT